MAPQAPPAESQSTTTAQRTTLVAILASPIPMANLGPLLVRALVVDGIDPRAAAVAVTLAGRTVGSLFTPMGSAGRDARNQEIAYRAAYLLASARRLSQTLTEALSQGKSSGDGIRAGLATERRFWRMHLMASRGRAAAAHLVDVAAEKHGPLLGWYAKPLATPECAAADGHNFDATRRPVIGWPGSVHVHCRCHPGAPHPGNPATVDQATAGIHTP